ncbi:ABC transporter permease [Mobilicoccus pelagius]|uniref:ABC transporter permease protein n=1 Tax=Mobilicoccus pelagius NBRC 104925 TaxID=1089455 RepID=H5UR21_9MICO|nr:ABC transporter permease [Mobilicoccus pelagius]GAB48179.1 hypothetical protein MOPEL_067_00280 [Mobilicoccus pelagius NBRC 104925]
MITSLRAELLRLLGTPATGRFLLGGLAIGLFLTGGLVLLGPERMNPPMPLPDTPTAARGLLGVLVLSAPVPVLLGSRSMTDEYEHHTIVPTLTAQPRRAVVVLAKLLSALLTGLAYGAVLAVGAAVGMWGGCRLAGIHLGLEVPALLADVGRIGLAMALYTVIGVGIGALVPRPQLCLGLIVGWFYLAESLLSVVPGARSAYPWFPGGAAGAVTGQSFVLDALAQTSGTAPVELLPGWAGALVLLGYAAVAAGVALVTTLRVDVR